MTGPAGERLAAVETKVDDIRQDVRDIRAMVFSEFKAVRAEAEAEFRAVRTENETDRKRITALEFFKGWFVTLATAVGFLFGLFTETVKKKLGWS